MKANRAQELEPSQMSDEEKVLVSKLIEVLRSKNKKFGIALERFIDLLLSLETDIAQRGAAKKTSEADSARTAPELSGSQPN
jgi:hypothetical protein